MKAIVEAKKERKTKKGERKMQTSKKALQHKKGVRGNVLWQGCVGNEKESMYYSQVQYTKVK